MARIGTLKGTFLAPGVSRNHRRYNRENIGRAVARMQSRLASGQTIPMHTSHKAHAEGDTRATAANVTKVYQDDEGRARFEADILPTEAGRDIAALAVPDKKGNAALKTVSIFGSWVGGVTKDDDGNDTAPDIDITGIDFTHHPGVGNARIDDGKLGESVPVGTICESAEDIEMTVEATEERPSALALLEAEMKHRFDDGTCRSCVGEDGKSPYGDVAYADPGYRKDKKKRYPIDTKGHARAAWSYINKAKNAAFYSSAQLARIKSKIKAACKRFGIDVAKESEEMAGLLERMGAEFVDVIEAYASTTLDNGAASINVSGYINEPADLAKAGAAMARAALAGLLALDPDNDGDIDIGKAQPGHEADDDDMECDSCGAGFPGPAMFCPNCGQPIPGAESAPGQPKESRMANHTAEQVKALLTAEQAATLDPAKTEYTTEELRTLLAPPAAATEATKSPLEVLAEALKASTAPAPVVEDELTKARRLVAEADAAAAAKPVTAAELKTFAESLVEATTKKVREEVIEDVRRSGAVTRRGLVAQARALEGVTVESDAKTLAAMSATDFADAALKAFDPLLPQSA